MRVLRIIASLDPRHGGPVAGLIASSAALAELHGVETEVVCLDPPDAPYLRAVPGKVHAIGAGIGRYRYNPGLNGVVAERARHCDVALVHGLWNHAAVGARVALRQSGLSHFVFAHGMLDPWFRRSALRRHGKSLYWRLWQREVLASAQAVLFTSETERVRSGLAGHADFVCRVVRYGVAPPPDDDGDRFLGERSWGGRPYVLFLGRLHPKKGCDLLIEAYAGTPGFAQRYDLVLAGPDAGGFGAELRARVHRLGLEGRVRFPGMVEGDEKWALLRGAEALVLPSHQENFGIVVAEAMAAGRPVLVSDQVNIAGDIARAGAGLVAPDTLEGTRTLLSRFLALEPEERDRIGANGRLHFERHYSARAAADDLYDIFQQARKRPAA